MTEEKCFYLSNGAIVTFTPRIKTYEDRISTDSLLLVATTTSHSWWNLKRLQAAIACRVDDIRLRLCRDAYEIDACYWYFRPSELKKLVAFLGDLGVDVKVEGESQ